MADDDAQLLPPILIEWTAGSGDARRATLSSLKQAGLWKRTLLLAGGVAVIFAAVCIVTGSGWPLGLLIGGVLFLLYTAVAVGSALVCAHLQNRKVLKNGSRWGSGKNTTHARFDTPSGTLLFRREDIITNSNAGELVLLTVQPNQTFAFPRALFAPPVWLPLPHDETLDGSS